MATLTLLSPPAPLGLHYGEQQVLVLRYRQSGQSNGGVTLDIHLDSDTNSGATVSADRIVTNDNGEASVRLTAGAAETAFHVLVSAPNAVDLSIDVAVSKYAFGNLDLSIDATLVAPSTTMVRGALIKDVLCSTLVPTPKLGTVLRSAQANQSLAVLAFPTLLVAPYAAIGRAEDSNGHLLAYGCVDLPAQLLQTGQRAIIGVPLQAIYPNPVGSYSLTETVDLKPMLPLLWQRLACDDGVGQVFLDAIIAALPPADSALATRLSTLRPAADAQGCRTGAATIDERLHKQLTATAAGDKLFRAATGFLPILDTVEINGQLDVFVATPLDILGRHTLLSAHFGPGPAMPYSLSTVPVPSARLVLTQDGDKLLSPEHALTLRLPSLWRRALDELVLTPAGITMSPPQLLQSAVTAAQSGVLTGCDAIEVVVCSGVTPPCAGKILTPCASAESSVANALTAALSDAAPAIDLQLSMTMSLVDPDGTLQAQGLDPIGLSGWVVVGEGTVPVSGSAIGARLP